MTAPLCLNQSNVLNLIEEKSTPLYIDDNLNLYLQPWDPDIHIYHNDPIHWDNDYAPQT